MFHHVARHDDVSIILGVDDDDPELNNYRGLESDLVRVSIAPRTNVNATFDRLMQEAQGDIVGWGSDDVVCETQHWDEITRDAIGEADIGFWRPRIRGQASDTVAAYLFMPKTFEERIRRAQGFVVPPFFPYWFGDTWLDDIAVLIARRHEMAWSYRPSGNGLTRGMRDLPFWTGYFNALRPARLNAAVAIVGDETVRPMVEFIAAMARFEFDPSLFERAESMAEPEPNPLYDRQKKRAEKSLALLREHA
jgi:hypothetical protein